MGWDVYRRNPALEPETLIYWASNPTTTPADITIINANMKLIKYSTGITISSLTAKMGLVLTDGKVPVTQCSTPISPYALISGASFDFFDGAKHVVFTGGAAGTGETYGTDLIAGWNLTNWGIIAAATVVDADTFSTTGNGGVSKQILINGALFKVAFSRSTTASACDVFDSTAVGVKFTNGNSTGYGTSVDANRNLYIRNTGAGSTDVATISTFQVLTADTTGLNATAVTDGGVTANSATWTLTITR